MQKNAVLGIVGCYALSDHIIRLIDRDEDVKHVFVVDNAFGSRFVKKAEERCPGKNFVLVGEGEMPESNDGACSIKLWLNPEDLHNEPAAILRTQERCLKVLAGQVGSVLFCYGLCRSSDSKLAELSGVAAIPVTFLVDESGEIVDDCFAAIVGGKKEYVRFFFENKGALFATTGYTEAWKMKHETLGIESLVQQVVELKGLFEALNYQRIIRFDDGVGDRDGFEKDVEAFSATFDLQVVTKRCVSQVFDRSYDLAKDKMSGRGSMIANGTECSPSESNSWAFTSLQSNEMGMAASDVASGHMMIWQSH